MIAVIAAAGLPPPGARRVRQAAYRPERDAAPEARPTGGGPGMKRPRSVFRAGQIRRHA